MPRTTTFQLTVTHTAKFNPQQLIDYLTACIVEPDLQGEMPMAAIKTFTIDIDSECSICHNPAPVNSMIPVMYLDGADKSQPMGPELVCDHCYETECNAPGWGWSNDYNSMMEYKQNKDGSWRWKGRSDD